MSMCVFADILASKSFRGRKTIIIIIIIKINNPFEVVRGMKLPFIYLVYN